MKAIKGGLLFGILVLMVSACFDAPEFPISPTIDFVGICFKPKGSAAGAVDSLIVTLTFKDGDGDMGLSPTSDIDEPFHEKNLFLANNGQLIPVGRSRLYSNLPYQFLTIPPGVTGKLVRPRTRKEPGYESLVPAYTTDQETCTFYAYETAYISQPDFGIIDTTTTEVVDVGHDGVNPDYIVVRDTFYYQKNPNYSNYDVEFWVKEGGDFVLYDWSKEVCVDFNGRFPILGEEKGPLEGNLRYVMQSSGFLATFSIKTLKLRIKVKDRAFHESNVIETGEFTLEKITGKCP